MAFYPGFANGLPPASRPSTSAGYETAKSATGPSFPSDITPPDNDMSSTSVSDFFEPAMDGPPSPGKLRQLNKQMRRASHLRRHHGHRTASSASSSLTSLSGDSPDWEQAFETMALARRSSTISVESAMPSSQRDRSNSGHAFGKSLFHRRARSKREESANSSSASSIYSSDLPGDNGILAGSKDFFMPSIFSRRKHSRDDTVQRRPHISSPFNFQHVTHTHRDNVLDINRINGPVDRLAMRATGPTTTPSPAITPDVHAFRFFNNSSDALDQPAKSSVATGLSRLGKGHHHHAVSAPKPRRKPAHARSQDQLRDIECRSPPQRPPRSPTHQQTIIPLRNPIPPPRVSSRQSAYSNSVAQERAVMERPQTRSDFYQAQSSDHLGSVDAAPRPASHIEHTLTKHESIVISTGRVCLSPVTTSEPTWPLASPNVAALESPLPDVPEEDEHHAMPRRSRLSLASNCSSLRACQSVPMLRSLARSQRPASGTSETLGYIDSSATHWSIKESCPENCVEEHVHEGDNIEENWEDDIDYCYEHEAEANCNYRWERSSLDTTRDNYPSFAESLVTDADDEFHAPVSTAGSSPGMLSVSVFDMPALSPVSQASTPTCIEAVTPTSNLSATSNFSLPRGDLKKGRPSMLSFSQRASYSSSFKESHGFTLSPSLLIPGDFQHQMVLAKGEDNHEYPHVDELLDSYHQVKYFDETADHLAEDRKKWCQQRVSTSTTGTTSTSQSDSTGERHTSVNSSWTTFTRHTTSSSSLNKMASPWIETAEPLPIASSTDQPLRDGDDDTTPPATQDTVPELTLFPSTLAGKKSFHKAHASESCMHDEVPPMKSQECLIMRRPRARTASLSAQVPPVGQYALFPRSYYGDRV